MSKLKLRPWKFGEDEEMRLHWIRSPFKKNNKWTLEVVFVSDSLKEDATSLFKYGVNQIHTTLEVPWGILPNLRVGRVYKNGVVRKPSKTTEKKSLSFVDLQSGEICEASELPKGLYDFYDDLNFVKEKIWKFKVDEKTYFLPCLELIRSFFATSKTFTNQLLKTDGLESLIDDEYQDGETLHVTLSHEIPRSIIKDDLITHFLWIYYNETARNCWESIYNKLLSTAIKKSPNNATSVLSAGIPLSMNPPISGLCHIDFTCTTFKDSVLIHELLAIKGFPALEFDKIRYSHPSFRKKTKTGKNKNRKKGIPVTRSNNFKQDSARKRVRTDTNQPTVKIPETVFGFSRMPDIKRELISENISYSDQSSVSSRNADTRAIVRNISKNKVVGTDESYLGGKISPVELVGLKLIESKDSLGLQSFLKTLKKLKKLDSQISITYKIYYIPGDFSFCFWRRALRRSLVLSCIYRKELQPVYIFEVSRPDGWSISTLLLQFDPKIGKQRKVNEILLAIVNEMTKNNGHWHIENLRQSADLRFIQIKHYEEDNPENRANRILQKLWLLGFR